MVNNFSKAYKRLAKQLLKDYQQYIFCNRFGSNDSSSYKNRVKDEDSFGCVLFINLEMYRLHAC